MQTPIEKKLQAESLKRLAETFLGKKNFSWWAILYAGLIFIVTGWLPDGIADLLRKDWFEACYKIITSATILLIMGVKIKNTLKYEGKIEVDSKPSEKVKLLAVFLSPLFRKLKPENLEEVLKASNFSKQTLKDTEWEMIYTTIDYHLPERLYIFTSSGPRGTTRLIPLFTKAFSSLYPNLIIVEFTENGIDFENIKDVFNSIEELYHKVVGEGVKEKEILVDITGGQKTNSIAAAIATLAMGRRFQYVSTRDKSVLSYDVIYSDE